MGLSDVFPKRLQARLPENARDLTSLRRHGSDGPRAPRLLAGRAAVHRSRRYTAPRGKPL